VENIVEIRRRKKFSLDEAKEILPLVFRLTEESAIFVKKRQKHLDALPNQKSEKALQIETEIAEVVQKWQSKLEKLGAVPKGLWLADFDNGFGYYCWKYPETDIVHWHGYQDGFSNRQPLADLTF
jgi:hypothetical protein